MHAIRSEERSTPEGIPFANGNEMCMRSQASLQASAISFDDGKRKTQRRISCNKDFNILKVCKFKAILI